MPTGIACAECGSPLKVVIHRGEFRVKDGSTLDNINFETVEQVNLVGSKPKEDNDDMLHIEVVCEKDPNHMIFSIASSRIKCEIAQRMEMGARRIRVKYTG